MPTYTHSRHEFRRRLGYQRKHVWEDLKSFRWRKEFNLKPTATFTPSMLIRHLEDTFFRNLPLALKLDFCRVAIHYGSWPRVRLASLSGLNMKMFKQCQQLRFSSFSTLTLITHWPIKAHPLPLVTVSHDIYIVCQPLGVGWRSSENSYCTLINYHRLQESSF